MTYNVLSGTLNLTQSINRQSLILMMMIMILMVMMMMMILMVMVVVTDCIHPCLDRHVCRPRRCHLRRHLSNHSASLV